MSRERRYGCMEALVRVVTERPGISPDDLARALAGQWDRPCIRHALRRARLAGAVEPDGLLVATDRAGVPDDPTQARMLRRVRTGRWTTVELRDDLGIGHVTAWKHVTALREAGWLRPDGVYPTGRPLPARSKPGAVRWGVVRLDVLDALGRLDGEGSAGAIVTESGHPTERVRRALRDLAASGVVVALGEGRRRTYRLAHRPAWRAA